MQKQKLLTLVGAGPGDPELITLKAIKAIKAADVILYDALAHPSFLDYATDTCQKIFVGKKVGVCQFKQEDINDLIVKHAREDGHVVRLKGGIEVAIVPGLSSIYSVPELHGIPLTRRGINESFWVTTGTTQDHQLSEDIIIAAQTKATATVVILMGMSKLSQIVAVYKAEHKHQCPIAIIQNGSLPEEKKVIGTIDTIEQLVKENNLSSPAVIVIGHVVELGWK
jgi:uroporphyrin-III C-methyltransferase